MIVTIGMGARVKASNARTSTRSWAVAAALDAEKLVYLTDVAGSTATTRTRSTLISLDIDAVGRRSSWCATGRPPKGMIPKLTSWSVAVLAQRLTRRGHPRRPHPGCPAARVLHPREASATTGGPMNDVMSLDEPGQARRRARHADVRADSGRLRARRGRPALGHRRPGVPGLPRRARGHVDRPKRGPQVANAIRRPGEHAAARLEPLLQRGEQPQLGERLDLLLTSATGTPGRVFFAIGAEANECAIKLACRYGQSNGGPDRFHVLSAYNSFHGRTLSMLAATGQPAKQETFEALRTETLPGWSSRISSSVRRWTNGSARCCSRPSRAKAVSSLCRPATSKPSATWRDEREALVL